MFRKCKYCKNEFNGKGYFCSDVCEIKKYVSEYGLINEKRIILPIKEGFDQVKKEDIEKPNLDQTHTEVSLTIPKPKPDELNRGLFH